MTRAPPRRSRFWTAEGLPSEPDRLGGRALECLERGCRAPEALRFRACVFRGAADRRRGAAEAVRRPPKREVRSPRERLSSRDRASRNVQAADRVPADTREGMRKSSRRRHHEATAAARHRLAVGSRNACVLSGTRAATVEALVSTPLPLGHPVPERDAHHADAPLLRETVETAVSQPPSGGLPSAPQAAHCAANGFTVQPS
jgi:hypothetical protein